MLKDKLTLVTPSYNRHAYVKRMLDYYKESEITVIVMDGTKRPFPDMDAYPSLEYHRSDSLPMQRFIEGVELVRTPYLLFSPDDVIFSIPAMEECVSFLESNLDYAGVEGFQTSLYYSEDGYYCKMGRNLSVDLASGSSSDRMFKMLAYGPQFWRFWRTSPCKDVLTNFPHEKYQDFYVGMLSELMINIAASIVGKYKSLPLFFSLHEDVRSVQPNERKGFSFWDFCMKGNDSKLYESYVSDIVDFLMEHESISRDAAELYCKYVIQLFASNTIGSNTKKTIAQRIRNELRSVWRKTVGKRAFQEKKRVQKQNFEELNASRIAAMTPESLAEMNKIAEFVFNYPRCYPNKD